MMHVNNNFVFNRTPSHMQQSSQSDIQSHNFLPTSTGVYTNNVYNGDHHHNNADIDNNQTGHPLYTHDYSSNPTYSHHFNVNNYRHRHFNQDENGGNINMNNHLNVNQRSRFDNENKHNDNDDDNCNYYNELELQDIIISTNNITLTEQGKIMINSIINSIKNENINYNYSINGNNCNYKSGNIWVVSVEKTKDNRTKMSFGICDNVNLVCTGYQEKLQVALNSNNLNRYPNDNRNSNCNSNPSNCKTNNQIKYDDNYNYNYEYHGQHGQSVLYNNLTGNYNVPIKQDRNNFQVMDMHR